MIKHAVTAFVFSLIAIIGYSYEISVGSFVANPGKQVVVPIELDSAAGLSYAGATISYDPQVLMIAKVEPGTLKNIMAEDFVAADTNGVLNVAIFGSSKTNIVSGCGSIANITFILRGGSAGLYSDISVTDVELGENTGVKDVTINNPIRTINGMIRAFSSEAAVSRLENPQIIAPETTLASLTLDSCDKIQASDSQKPIIINGSVIAKAAIDVIPPPSSWASGQYELLKTTTSGLSFNLLNADAGWEITTSTENGINTYIASITVADEIPIICDEPLSLGTKNQIRNNIKLLFEGKNDEASLALRAKFEQAKKIVVNGTSEDISIISYMGIAPSIDSLDDDGTLTISFALPKLEITSFDHSTGAVRIKVTPNDGNSIVSEIATGYIHVYGTDNLAKKMQYISKVGFDLTPYLKENTKGEVIINVTLGSHTFLKVKIESISKQDGDLE